MAYVQQDDPDLIDDLLQRKEFYWHKKWAAKKTDHGSIIPRFLLEDAIAKSGNLQLSSYQMFVRNYINPHTPYQRLLLKWETGTGKTIGALSIAMNFIKNYRMEHEIGNTEIGSVFIIGFSERVFKNELLRFPEFGFLSKEERKRLDKLKRIAAVGSEQDIDAYHDAISHIKRQFSSRKGNGFFKFYGYKAFVNRILIADKDVDLNSLSEDQIRTHIKNGKIKYNEELIKQFKNSLMICDEIHNVYNSLEKNNWGVAIQAVLDHEPTCRAVFASATPLNNSPTEIIDLLNLLLPSDKRLKKSDFFNSKYELKPNALSQIAELSRGRVSFLRDVNPKYYPSISMHGQSIPSIPYLKFIRCKMSDFHYATYKEIYHGTLSQDSQYIVDFVLENPTDPKMGLYQTNAIKSALTNAPQKWKDKHGLDFKDGKIIGDALHKDTLPRYSAKYAKMLDEIMQVIKQGNGKIFIYHNVVHMSGVLFIEQVLLKNGFLDEFAGANANTICMRCGDIKKHHKDNVVMGSGEEVKKKIIVLSDGSEVVYKNNRIIWNCDNKEMLQIHKRKNDGHWIPSNSMDNDLINGKSYALRGLTELLSKIKSSRISIKVPAYAPRLGEWLLQIGYKIAIHNNKYSILAKHFDDINNAEQNSEYNTEDAITKHNKSAHGGRVKDNKHNSNSKHQPHMFIPARFVMAHSDIDKAQMEHAIEKFNNPDNADGNRFMILVGSKIIKESYDIKAVQNVFIMGRPDNIPTLMQIRGRAIRKHSHADLPPNHRHVNIKIFTTCLPIMNKHGHYALSYEEEKYRDKILDYQLIQKIEKTLHENAVDAFINKDIIHGDTLLGNMHKTDPLAILPFEPNINKKFNKELDIGQLNTTSFDIYHSDKEVDVIKSIIKRLFIEISGVWKYQDLFDYVREQRYDIEINTHLFTENHFIIALDQLTWSNDTNYVEPVIQKNSDTMSMTQIIDRLYDSTDKVITLLSGQHSIIVPITDNKNNSSSDHLDNQYYVLFPLNDKNEPDLDIELPYRVSKQETRKTINMNNFVQTKRIDFDYTEKKAIFHRRFVDVSIENMENVVCEYGSSFHIKFLEECIEYVFRAWTDPLLEKSDFHEFYFKMLYYYDLLGLVMWAYTCKPRVFKEYTKYAIPVKAKDIKLKAMSKYEKRKEELDDVSPEDTSDLATSGVINMLKSSINKSSNMWIPREFREQYDKTVKESLELFTGKRKKNKYINKTSAMLLPIGHYISKFPKIYHPEKGWSEDPIYVQKEQQFIENNVIIGYDDRSATGVHIRFKIRNPIHNIRKYEDTRLIEKGGVCKSKSKTYLISIAKKLDITLPDKTNVDELCVLIRTKLIRLELKERIKKSNIKYFYFIYEQNMPI